MIATPEANPTLATPTSPTTPPTERRTAHRQAAIGTICRIDAEGMDRSMALVWNISSSGISMLIPRPLEPGSGIVGVLETIRGRHPLSVGMKVVHMKQLETGDFWMGAQFEKPLSPAEMKPFVG